MTDIKKVFQQDYTGLLKNDPKVNEILKQVKGDK